MASMWPPKKNTAFTLYFTLYKNDGTVVANPGTITKKVSIDGGDVADIAANVTEENTTYGQCSLVIAAGEMNGDAIWIYIADDTSGCVPFTATIYTTGNTQDGIEAKVDDVPTVAEFEARTLAAASYFDPAADAVAHVTLCDTCTTNTDMRGTDNAATAADVNEQVLDVLNVDIFAEPGQGAPAATASLVAKIGYLYKAWRNRITQTASQYSLYGDDAETVDQKAAFSDDATTADRGEIESGP